MSQTEGSPVSLNVISRDGFEWRQSIITLMLVLAPVMLAVIVMTIGIAAWETWLVLHGAPAELPAPPTIKLYGLLSYAVGSWLAVALVLVWTSRTLRPEVFKFRRLNILAFASSLIGFGIATFGVLIVIHWLTNVMGNRSQDVRIDFDDAKSVAIVVFCSL